MEVTPHNGITPKWKTLFQPGFIIHPLIYCCNTSICRHSFYYFRQWKRFWRVHITPPVNRFYSSFYRKSSMISQHFSESWVDSAFNSVIRRWCNEIIYKFLIQVCKQCVFFDKFKKGDLSALSSLSWVGLLLPCSSTVISLRNSWYFFIHSVKRVTHVSASCFSFILSKSLARQ